MRGTLYAISAEPFYRHGKGETMQQYPYQTADEQPTVFTNGSNAVLNTAESAQTAYNKPMPKLPTLEEVYTSVQCGPYCELSYRERHVLEACYEFIGRQLSA